MKVRRIRSTAGPHFGMWCPGCESPHVVSSGWTFNGDVERPTFQPSIAVRYHDGRVCHSYVIDGRWQFFPDTFHELSGKTVDVPEWPSDFVVHEAPE